MKIVNIKADKMRYQKNTSAYGLVLLSIATSLIALFTMINFDTFGSGEGTMRVIPNLRVGVEIALGIVLMLSTFMAAEKVKYYDPTWSFFGLFILAGINFLESLICQSMLMKEDGFQQKQCNSLCWSLL